MRLGQRIKGFFGRMGKGIKKGVSWAWDKGKKIVKKVAEVAPKVIQGARMILPFIPGGKAKDIATKVVDKSDEAYRKGKEIYAKGKDVYDKGKAVYEAGRSMFK